MMGTNNSSVAIMCLQLGFFDCCDCFMAYDENLDIINFGESHLCLSLHGVYNNYCKGLYRGHVVKNEDSRTIRVAIALLLQVNFTHNVVSHMSSCVVVHLPCFFPSYVLPLT